MSALTSGFTVGIIAYAFHKGGVKNFAYTPAGPEDLAGPLPLIVLDETPA